MDEQEKENEKKLQKALTHVLEECRMVLPGIQALFGFQLIAVFSPGFDSHLDAPGQVLHLAAIVLVTLAIALVMTPAAYHRLCMPEGVSEGFILLASKLLLLSMVPLALGICLELFLIASIVLESVAVAGAIASLVALVFAGLWFALPRVHARRESGTNRSRGGRKLTPHVAH